MGYHIGYQRGVTYACDCITNTIKEELIYDPIYDDPWWDTNWTKLIIDNNTYIYYTEDCTENQINEFIRGNNTLYDDDFSGCCIWRIK